MEFMVHEEYGEALVDNGSISFEYAPSLYASNTFSNNSFSINDFRKNYIEEGDIVHSDKYGHGEVIRLLPTFSLRYQVKFFATNKMFFCSAIIAEEREYAIRLSRKRIPPFKNGEEILLDEGVAIIEKFYESYQERVYSVRMPDEKLRSFNEHLMFFRCRKIMERDVFSLDGDIL